ncbi:MAG: hypothetical protein AAF762_09375 [Pseudomonadota bacterium]
MADTHTTQAQPGFFDRNKGAFAGLTVGIAAPLILVALFLVTYRGYGITEEAPVPQQVYTDF